MTKSIFFVDEVCPDARENNAGSKAREDVSTILQDMGVTKLEMPYDLEARRAASVSKRMAIHLTAAHDWNRTLSAVNPGDAVIIQFPLLHHSIMAKKPFATARRRGIKIILLIHDLDFIRAGAQKSKSIATRSRIRAEELSLLELASAIIVHNEQMRDAIVNSCNIDSGKIVSLQIFDYLIEDNAEQTGTLGPKTPVVIAGNLSDQKAGYIYKLPANAEFNLYGFGYEDAGQANIHYKGEFVPEELPAKLEGSFGLVWDGESAQTCTGAYGNYLRVNNPHKTSLYIATGLPVIIWDQAALAPFVKEHGVGITVSSLYELPSAVNDISDTHYEQMRKNVNVLSQQLRSGHFTKQAIERAISLPTPWQGQGG